MTNNTFKKNLKEIRSKKYPSQKIFAEVLNIPYTTYSQYENGKREPSFEKLVLIADTLDVSIDTLLRGVTPKTLMEYIYQTLKDNMLSEEKIIDYSQENDGFRIKTSSGLIDISQSLCDEIIANSRKKQKEYIRSEIRKQLMKQRQS